MPDDPTNPGPEDGRLIALTQPHEVRWWCGKFGVTEKRLSEAVDAVGHGVVYVEDWLNEHPEEA